MLKNSLENKIESPNIKLYSIVTSPYAMKVHSYLLYKKLPFNIEYVNPANLVKKLPIGSTVPVLTINQKSHSESSLIGHWIDELFPESPSLIPSEDESRSAVIEMDDWVTNELIPLVFYSIYPCIDRHFIKQCKNNLYLGKCVSKTCNDKQMKLLRLFWPLIIYRAQFIRKLIKPLIIKGKVNECRAEVLGVLENKLSENYYLAGTSLPSLADLSAWPLITVPYQLGLDFVDDFLSYPNIVKWVERINERIQNNNPPLIPPNLVIKKIFK